ncbi:MAG: histidine kinase [Bacteroidales bacterium]|nr:histidine kinase [Bacteroidales bacterium]
MVIASLIEALIVGLGIPFNIKQGGSENLGILLTVSILAQITVYCIVYIINYALTSRDEMNRQREAANMAQYRYLKLKRQVNPHFLFNSLNILDCLVCEEKTEQASTYIHKLAGIYRYMLKSEDEDLVQLHEELVFVGLYVDLLKVRFPEGFEVEIDVPEDMMARFVLPCSLQLLIENATKHNAVSSDNPLTIRIEAEGNRITVSNNIIPKVTTSPSTGLGQKYIRQQYLDLSGKEIDIRKTEDTYCVTLPLL